MLHFFCVGVLPFLDGIQITSSETRLPRETYMSLECPLSLCCPFPTIPVKLPNSQALSAVRKGAGHAEQQSGGSEEPPSASRTAARILMNAR